jgi:hypothetical protein
MGSSNRAHRVRRWVIIEKDAAATVDLQVDEAGRKQRPRWHNFDRPVIRIAITRRNALNHSTIDHDQGIVVPPMAIENAVSRDCRRAASGISVWFWTHCLASSLAKLQADQSADRL